MPDQALVDYAKASAAKYGVPENLFLAQIQQESGWNTTAQNPAWPVSQGGPAGIAQFTVGTAKQYGINPLDPYQSIDAAARYNADLYKQTGSWEKVLQRYGTVPTSGNLTPSQQALANAATGLDKSGQGLGGTGNPLVTPVGGPPVGGGNPIQQAGSWIYNIFIRFALIMLGVILVWQGLAMLRGSNVIENTKTVYRYAGTKMKKAA